MTAYAQDSVCAPTEVQSRWRVWLAHFSNLGRPASLERALVAYMFLVAFVILAMYRFVRLRAWSAVVFGLIAGQVFLNVVFLPIRLDFWSEFSSAVAIYGLVQILTPLVVVVYALAAALTDRREKPRR